MKNKQLHYILFRLFWDDKPVGFEYWDAETGYNYTYGESEKRDGYKNWGWCGKKIPHNNKEILDIQYIDDKYLKQKEERINLGKEIVMNMNIARILSGKEPS
jgi:hypothetical protein